jgi:hypothetical protein
VVAVLPARAPSTASPGGQRWAMTQCDPAQLGQRGLEGDARDAIGQRQAARRVLYCASQE